VPRKVAKRSERWYIAPPPPPNIAAPLPPPTTPQVEEIPAIQEPRVEEPLPTTTDETARKTPSLDISADLPTLATPPPSAATVDVSTRLRSRRQTQLPPTETSEVEVDDSDAFDDADDADYVDDGDLSGPISPPTANVNISTRHRSSRRTSTPVPPPPAPMNVLTRRRSSRRVIPTSSTGTPIPPPSTAAVDVSTRHRSRRQIQLPRIEKSETQRDNGDDDLTDNVDAHDDALFGPFWEARLRELTEYRKFHGHCNVPANYSENIQLGKWVSKQKRNYKLHREGKKSPMTIFRIQALESLGFEWEWNSYGAAWEGRLSELADYRKIHGHCNIPSNNSENTKLCQWVQTQKTEYRLHLEGRPSSMTLSRIQALEGLGFEWDSSGAFWKNRLSELVDYRKIYGDCNVPQTYSKNTKLGMWVANQRRYYKLHREGKKLPMTIFRIQALESLGLEWERTSFGTVWEDRLSELADYREKHGHCNVPRGYSENTKLGMWVGGQRNEYRLHLEGRPIVYVPSPCRGIGKLRFRMGQSRHRLGRPFERTCRLSENLRALQCS
jgi:hypothetical protein